MNDLDLPRDPSDSRLQSAWIPFDFELTALCRDLRQFGYGDEVWRNHFGQAMLLTRRPDKIDIYGDDLAGPQEMVGTACLRTLAP